MFKDRIDAAHRLIPDLKHLVKQDVLVLAIPRGGVPLGFEIAKAYQWPMDLLLTKKIGHPMNPELAIGSVSLEGQVLDPRFSEYSTYAEEQVPKIREALHARYTLFKGKQQPISMKGKTVVIIDDGIATGNTMLASLDVVRHHEPVRIIVAIPVAPPETVQKLKRKADEVICLLTPSDFQAVGQFYEDFEQVSDEEVIRLLQELPPQT